MLLSSINLQHILMVLLLRSRSCPAQPVLLKGTKMEAVDVVQWTTVMESHSNQ